MQEFDPRLKKTVDMADEGMCGSKEVPGFLAYESEDLAQTAWGP